MVQDRVGGESRGSCMARLQHKPGMSNFAVAIRLKDVSHPTANGLLHQLRTTRHLHVTLPSGVVCVPAVDHGASTGLRAVRVLVLGLDPLAHREGIIPALLRCAGYNVTDIPGPGCVHVASEQAGSPRVGGVADITTVVSYVVPPQDDPFLHRLPVSFVDYADNVTHVLVHGDPLAPAPGLRNPGSPARQYTAPVHQPAPSPPPPGCSAPPPPPAPHPTTMTSWSAPPPIAVMAVPTSEQCLAHPPLCVVGIAGLGTRADPDPPLQASGLPPPPGSLVHQPPCRSSTAAAPSVPGVHTPHLGTLLDYQGRFTRASSPLPDSAHDR